MSNFSTQSIIDFSYYLSITFAFWGYLKIRHIILIWRSESIFDLSTLYVHVISTKVKVDKISLNHKTHVTLIIKVRGNVLVGQYWFMNGLINAQGWMANEVRAKDSNARDWCKKTGLVKKLASNKKSAILTQWSWNFVKSTTSWVGDIEKVWARLDKNCRFFTIGQFLGHSRFLCTSL